MKIFAGENATHFGELGMDVLYLNTLENVHTPTTVGQQWRGGVDTAQFTNSQLGWYYYTIQARSEYTAQQAAKLGQLLPGISIDGLLDKFCRQGINQRRHYAALFGFDPEETQGIIKQGVATNLPASTSGKTKITTYEPTELVEYLAGQARTAMDNTYGMAKPVILMSSVRIINYIRTKIVPLSTYQNPGAGVSAIGGVYDRIVADWLGVGKVTFIADDLLKGSGAAGVDQIVLVAPGLIEQDLVNPEYSQYQLGDLPLNMMNTFMDNAGGLIKTVNPVINRVASADYSLQSTAGAVIRQDAVRVIDAGYV